MNTFDKEIAKKYNSRFSKLGAVPEASLWFSEERQILRFKLISDILEKSKRGTTLSLNDIGCGYGAFVPYIFQRFPNTNILYNGYDIASNPLDYCKKAYKQESVCFKLGKVPDRLCDFSIMSGTYNYAPIFSSKAWHRYLFENLIQIWKYSRFGMIFNISVSQNARITAQNISYFNKDYVKHFCESHLGRTSLLSSEKLPKEVTISVAKT